jgi:transposase-like protein
MTELVEVGSLCPNPECLKHGQTEGNEIIRFGQTRQGRQRFRCKCCGRCFNENQGTLFYRKCTPEKEILETLALLAEGTRISSLSRAKGFKEDTILTWLRQAGEHAEAVEEVLLHDYEVGPSQIDGLWSYVGHKGAKKKLPETQTEGTFWRTTVLESETRLRVARGLEKSETAASEQAFGQLRQRGNPETPPPLVSDGWGGIDQALIGVYGQVPSYRGRGRPPTRKQPGENWQYLQIIKHRDSTGNLIDVEHKVVFGNEAKVLSILGQSTAYVERTHLTMRHSSARLIRKGLGFSKDVLMHRAAAAWDDLVYNLARPLKTLRQQLTDALPKRWWPRTPAMAAGLADRIWTVGDILRAVPVPT